MTRALITGLSGVCLTPAEASFLAAERPAGIILFKRNIGSFEQIRRLIASAKDAIGRDDVLVLVDQEGGRVQRVKEPIARNLPPAAVYAELYGVDPASACRSAFNIARLAATELSALGFNMNCAPVLDLPVEGAHDIIGDRAYGRSADQVIALGRAVARGLMAGGVAPIIKHIPGHGRATADSHLDLPVVDTKLEVLSRTDFVPFRALFDMPAAMTAHVVYSDIDADNPASTSPLVTSKVIRGEIGFGGLLMSDDLSMKALSGPIRARAEAVIAAGSDVALHCNGDMNEMVEAAEGVPRLSGEAAARFDAAIAAAKRFEEFDVAEAEHELISIWSS